MNLDRLRGLMAERRKTQAECAEAIGVSHVTFSKKINGELRFYVQETLDLLDFLEASKEEKMRVFLE